MTKRLARLALAAAVASAIALPAAPANAACAGTFIRRCVAELLEPPPAKAGDSQHICLVEEATIGLFVCI
ncbi:MAG TPA: hypothetical protein VNA20_18965 [Frankiaceae bacterium]|nr:hypothetical protein [Frankiaceae bacterium]